MWATHMPIRPASLTGGNQPLTIGDLATVWPPRGGVVGLTRRAVLLTAIGAIVSACGAPDRPPAADAPPAPTSAPSKSAPLPVDPAARAEVVARYHGVRPAAWGVDVAGVTTRLPTRDSVLALTFDACGGPHGSGYDAGLIALLRRRSVPATLFINSRWIEANRTVFA